MIDITSGPRARLSRRSLGVAALVGAAAARTGWAAGVGSGSNALLADATKSRRFVDLVAVMSGATDSVRRRAQTATRQPASRAAAALPTAPQAGTASPDEMAGWARQVGHVVNEMTPSNRVSLRTDLRAILQELGASDPDARARRMIEAARISATFERSVA